MLPRQEESDRESEFDITFASTDERSRATCGSLGFPLAPERGVQEDKRERGEEEGSVNGRRQEKDGSANGGRQKKDGSVNMRTQRDRKSVV